MPDPAPIVSVVGYLSLDSIEGPRGAYRDCPGGAALYAALGARAAGGKARLVAKLCGDFPETVLDALVSLGLDLDELEPASGATRRARLVDPGASLDGSGERQSPHHENEDWWARTYALAPKPCAKTAQALVLGPMPAENLDGHLSAARAAGARVIADTSEAFAGTQGEELLARVPSFDLFAPSREEARLLFPGMSDEDAQDELARRCPRVVQKRGAEGLWWSSAGRPLTRWPSQARRIVESTGAGDALVGALAAGLARGLAVPELLELASEVAARNLSAVGPFGLGLPMPAFEGASHARRG